MTRIGVEYQSNLLASVLQASGFRRDAILFRLNATTESKGKLVLVP